MEGPLQEEVKGGEAGQGFSVVLGRRYSLETAPGLERESSHKLVVKIRI